PRPALDRRSGWVRGRSRVRPVRRRAVVAEQRLPPVGRVRRRHRRAGAKTRRPLRAAACAPGGARMRRALRPAVQLAGPVLLLVATAAIAAELSKERQLEFENAVVMAAIVVALYVFVGNSGVISFGHIIAVAAAFAYQRSRFGRQLRATREDPPAARASGIDVYRQRLFAFTLSGALAGLAGGLYVHQLGLISPDLFYLDLTFVTLAMLVFGGVGSLWGAVLGALVISALNSFLGDAENTVHVGFRLTLPAGTRLVTIGAAGARPLLSSVTFMSGTRHSDTHVEYLLDTATWIGPYRDTTPADAQRVVDLIVDAGLQAEAFDDLRPAQWSKLIFNATVNS